MGLQEAPTGGVFGSEQQLSSDFAHQTETVAVQFFDDSYQMLAELDASNETPILPSFTRDNLRGITGADQFVAEINRVQSEQGAHEANLRNAQSGETRAIRRDARHHLPWDEALVSRFPSWLIMLNSNPIPDEYKPKTTMVGAGWERLTLVDAYDPRVWDRTTAESRIGKSVAEGEKLSGVTFIEAHYGNNPVSDDYLAESCIRLEKHGPNNLWAKTVVYFLHDGGSVVVMVGYDPADRHKWMEVEFTADGTRLTNEEHNARKKATGRQYPPSGAWPL